MQSSALALIKIRIKEILNDPVQQDILQREIADKLLELVREDFVTRASGGAGTDGTSWKPVKKESGRIMVDTGRLLDSLEIKELPDGSYGVHFGIFPPLLNADKGRLIALQQRPAWSDPLPERWLKELRDITENWLRQNLRSFT